MADNDTELDFDNMSDEDFLKLGGPEAPPTEGVVEEDPAIQAGSVNHNDKDPNAGQEDPNAQNGEENNDDGTTPDGDDTFSGGDEPDGSGDDDSSNEPDPEGNEDTSGDANSGEGAGTTDPHAGEGKTSDGSEEDSSKTGEQPKTDAKKEGTNADGDKSKEGKDGGLTEQQTQVAVDFFKKITAPFKADGKDMQVRSAEDAIRLMQQGANYSRRMQELKPMKALNRMLQDHGLADPSKISFLIDVSKGDKAALTKLLKDHKVDPMDLDTSGEVRYQAKSYSGSPEENAFRDALDSAMASDEGKALVSEIHNTWDDASKQQLQRNPAVLGNLTELKRTGVYQKIADELAYQRSIGYLTDVPYLAAFDQVGEAMKNAGVFGQQPQPAPTGRPMGQLQDNTQPSGQPVASGARKAPAPKKPAPNPHLSSTPPAKQSKTPAQKPVQDYGELSDEDFLKMPPPK